MPPKTVTCSICGNEVLKARTYCVDAKLGKRACKTHEGVAEKKDELQKTQVRDKEQEKKREEEKKKRWHAENNPEPFKRKCYCCQKEGLHEQDWNLRFVVAREKVVQKYGVQYDGFVTMFSEDEEKKKKAAELLKKEFNAGQDPDKLRCLKIFADKPDDPKYKKLFRNIHRHAKTAVKILGAMMVCGECLGKHGIKIEMPEIVNADNFDQMMMVGAIMAEGIKKIAKKEIIDEAQRN